MSSWIVFLSLLAVALATSSNHPSAAQQAADQYRAETQGADGTVAGHYGYQSPDGSKVQVTYNAGGNKQQSPAANSYSSSGSKTNSGKATTSAQSQSNQNAHALTIAAPSTYAQHWFNPSHYAASQQQGVQGFSYGNQFPATTSYGSYAYPGYYNAYGYPSYSPYSSAQQMYLTAAQQYQAQQANQQLAAIAAQQYRAQSGKQHGAQGGVQHGAQSGQQYGAQSGQQHRAQGGQQHGAQSGQQHGAQSSQQYGSQISQQYAAQLAALSAASGLSKSHADASQQYAANQYGHQAQFYAFPAAHQSYSSQSATTPYRSFSYGVQSGNPLTYSGYPSYYGSYNPFYNNPQAAY